MDSQVSEVVGPALLDRGVLAAFRAPHRLNPLMVAQAVMTMARTQPSDNARTKAILDPPHGFECNGRLYRQAD